LNKFSGRDFILLPILHVGIQWRIDVRFESCEPLHNRYSVVNYPLVGAMVKSRLQCCELRSEDAHCPTNGAPVIGSHALCPRATMGETSHFKMHSFVLIACYVVTEKIVLPCGGKCSSVRSFHAWVDPNGILSVIPHDAILAFVILHAGLDARNNARVSRQRRSKSREHHHERHRKTGWGRVEEYDVTI
jgi:hypothetical protein